MRNRVAFVLFTLFFASCAVALAAPPAKDGKSHDRYIRVLHNASGVPTALETAIVHCVPKDTTKTSPTVDLIGAVHIADSAYYEQLNREFQNYDAVLYELVASEKARTPRRSDPPGTSPLSMIQNGMKDVLALEFQLKGIDYTRKNMVHADMSPKEFAQSMESRGETVWTMIGRMFGYAMSQQAEAGDTNNFDLLAALFAKNRPLALKRVLADQFDRSQDSMAALEGPEGSTLISGRNQVALNVLRKQIADGKKKIAIFYGAGHLADLQKRLATQFDMVPAETRWLVAWNLKSKD
jgi:hypothetical protein